MSAKETFLATYDREHETTMRVLRAYPEDQLDLKPHPKSNSARVLAWTFVLETYLGQRVWRDEFANGLTPGNPPKAPERWPEIVDAVDKASAEFRALIAGASDEELAQEVHFMTGPKTMGAITRLDWIWFLLHDQIHHRGQFSIYLRMAGGKVPSIYGPTADEPWI
jgi:uncharacterized damage-inducible protein DinB